MNDSEWKEPAERNDEEPAECREVEEGCLVGLVGDSMAFFLRLTILLLAGRARLEAFRERVEENWLRYSIARFWRKRRDCVARTGLCATRRRMRLLNSICEREMWNERVVRLEMPQLTHLKSGAVAGLSREHFAVVRVPMQELGVVACRGPDRGRCRVRENLEGFARFAVDETEVFSAVYGEEGRLRVV